MNTKNCSIKVVKASKALVDSILSTNNGNRPISSSRVHTLVRAIKSGYWYMNGSTITLDADGTLMDGQHRLTAIKEAGYPSDIELIIVQLPVSGKSRDDVYYTMNSGRTGSAAQIFAYRGIKNSNFKASVCRWLTNLIKNLGLGDVCDRHELVSTYERYKGEIERAAAFSGKGAIRFLSPMIAAFIAVANGRKDPEVVWDFVKSVHLGTNLQQGSVGYSLFRYCSMPSGHINTSKQKEQLLIALNAVYSYLDSPNKGIRSLRPTSKRSEKILERARADALVERSSRNAA